MNNKATNYISISGSVASIFALIIVLVQKNSPSSQLAMWKIILALICLLFLGGIVVYMYDFAKTIIKSDSTLRNKVLKMTFSIAFALILIGIVLDGVFAIVEWRWWMYDIIDFLARILRL